MAARPGAVPVDSVWAVAERRPAVQAQADDVTIVRCVASLMQQSVR
ncbi:MAG: hypothetical protein OJF60_000613 [Burkholderiaceae bacterium]|nr:MAG: hypothetical protein OJF60_000613 [Burkholderiaceae bacterium]